MITQTIIKYRQRLQNRWKTAPKALVRIWLQQGLNPGLQGTFVWNRLQTAKRIGNTHCYTKVVNETPVWSWYHILAMTRSWTQVCAISMEELAAFFMVTVINHWCCQPQDSLHPGRAWCIPPSKATCPCLCIMTLSRRPRAPYPGILVQARPCTKIRVSSKGFPKFSRALRARWRDKTSLEREAFFWDTSEKERPAIWPSRHPPWVDSAQN